jgi:Na+-translocating ferredoxin:NAD+ oxidoreductase RnfC subunit
MSEDLVKRLLYRANQWGMENTSDQRLMLEAADEIDRLTRVIEDLQTEAGDD